MIPAAIALAVFAAVAGVDVAAYLAGRAATRAWVTGDGSRGTRR